MSFKLQIEFTDEEWKKLSELAAYRKMTPEKCIRHFVAVSCAEGSWKHPSIAAVEFEKKQSEPPKVVVGGLGDPRLLLMCQARLTELHPCELMQGHEGGHQTTHNDRRIVFYYANHDEAAVKALLSEVPKST